MPPDTYPGTVKPDGGHHPHSLENPEPVVDFILQAWRKCSHA